MADRQLLRTSRFQDCDGFHESFAASWNELAFLEPLGQRPFHVAYRRFLTPNLFVMEMQTSGYRFGFSESDFMFLCVPLSSGVQAPGSDVACGQGSVVVYGQRPFHLALGDGASPYKGYHVGVRRSLLQAWGRSGEARRSRPPRSVAASFPISHARGLMAGLQRALPFVAPGVSCAPDFEASLEIEEQVMNALLDTSVGQYMAAASDSAPRAGDKPLARALEFIQASYDQAIGSQDIADAAGVGVRQLQISFREAFGKTPWQYLRDRRLDAARARIGRRDECVSVTMAALDSGFAHLGEFSRSYQERFGEKPSETRRRAMGCANERA